MTDSQLKVLFIAGAGRSGSTLLHNVLGQLDGYVAIGEVREIWHRGMLGNWLCGCGKPFDACPFWSQVISAAYGSADSVDAAHLAELTERFRIKHLPATLIPAARRRQLSEIDELLVALEELFVAIHEVSGSRVIVDSSKNPSFGYLLHEIPRFEVFDLHLVRHPAAVAFSWQQRKNFEPGRKMASKRPAESAGQWMARNIGVEGFIRPRSRHFAQLRYEDFVADPALWLDAITQWLGEPATVSPLTVDGAADFTEPDHSVFGNPTRFQHGTVQLRRDDRWVTQMNQKDVNEVGLIAWPLLARYGYALRSPAKRHKASKWFRELAGS